MAQIRTRGTTGQRSRNIVTTPTKAKKKKVEPTTKKKKVDSAPSKRPRGKGSKKNNPDYECVTSASGRKVWRKKVRPAQEVEYDATSTLADDFAPTSDPGDDFDTYDVRDPEERQALREMIDSISIDFDDISRMVDEDPGTLQLIVEQARNLYDSAVSDVELCYKKVSGYGPRPATREVLRYHREIATFMNRGRPDVVDECKRQFIEAVGGQERIDAEDEYVASLDRLGKLISLSIDAEWLSTPEGRTASIDNKCMNPDDAIEELARNASRMAAKNRSEEKDMVDALRLKLCFEAERQKVDITPAYLESASRKAERLDKSKQYKTFCALEQAGVLTYTGFRNYGGVMNGQLTKHFNAAMGGLQSRRDFIKKEISRFGKMGVQRTSKHPIDEGSVKKAVESFDRALQFFPQDMIDEAWEKSPVPPRMGYTKKRAHFVDREFFYKRKNVKALVDVNIEGFAIITQHTQGGISDLMAYNGMRGKKDTVPPEVVNPDVINMDWYDLTISSASLPDTPHNREVLSSRAKTFSSHDLSPKGNYSIVEFSSPDGEKRIGLTCDNPPAHNKYIASIRPFMNTGSTITSVHEMCHFIEAYNPRIGVACKRFVEQRTEGKKVDAGNAKEPQISDGFYSPYVSKVYAASTNGSEVFSMGMEGEYSGTSSHANGKPKDPGHRNLIYGILATGARPKKD